MKHWYMAGVLNPMDQMNGMRPDYGLNRALGAWHCALLPLHARIGCQGPGTISFNPLCARVGSWGPGTTPACQDWILGAQLAPAQPCVLGSGGLV